MQRTKPNERNEVEQEIEELKQALRTWRAVSLKAKKTQKLPPTTARDDMDELAYNECRYIDHEYLCEKNELEQEIKELKQQLAEARESRRRVMAQTKCKSCGKEADKKDDYCFGCGNVVCLKCAMQGGHHGVGEHGGIDG